jgi:hypothetical protein
MLAQGAITPEKISYRIAMVTGGITHPVLGVLPMQGSLPVPFVGLGTVKTDPTDSYKGTLVTGTGVNFLNDPPPASKPNFYGSVNPGDYIACNAAGQFLRRITKVWNDGLHLEIEAAFPSSLNSPFYIVKSSPFRLIIVKCVGAGALLQEQSMSLNEIFINGGSPITYDCSASGAALDIQANY